MSPPSLHQLKCSLGRKSDNWELMIWKDRSFKQYPTCHSVIVELQMSEKWKYFNSYFSAMCRVSTSLYSTSQSKGKHILYIWSDKDIQHLHKHFLLLPYNFNASKFTLFDRNLNVILGVSNLNCSFAFLLRFIISISNI